VDACPYFAVETSFLPADPVCLVAGEPGRGAPAGAGRAGQAGPPDRGLHGVADPARKENAHEEHCSYVRRKVDPLILGKIVNAIQRITRAWPS